MRHIKLFENYSDIDIDYIKELIEDFCIENNFVDLSHINPLIIHSDAVRENILDKDIFHIRYDDSIGVLFFRFIFFVRSGAYHQIMNRGKVCGVSSIRPNFLEQLEFLNKKIIKIINREGYKTWNAMDHVDESKRNEDKHLLLSSGESLHLYILKNNIQYSRK